VPRVVSTKRITDPLYGTIELTDVEAKLVSTPAFQRLHNVRQLGLAHLVFPSASYSRFSHSVGAAFNAGRIMEAINRNRAREDFSQEDIQLFRIAALFHDLGHYPFSHTTEHAVEDHYSNNFFAPEDGDERQTSFTKSSFDHEKLGHVILRFDPDISAILDDHDLSSGDVADRFLEPGKRTILSSDLDCDRLDYLRRTALHSGAPYGSVDVDFIISQATLDKGKRFCFGHKAFRAVDHLLVSRFFDFSQIPFHKTVASLEWSLEEAVKACLEAGLLPYSQDEVVELIKAGEWWMQDEPHFINLFRQLLASSSDQVLRDHLEAVLFRRAAKEICLVESFSKPAKGIVSAREKCERVRAALVSDGMADPSRLYVWSPKFRYAKSSPVAGRPASELSDEERFELIHVLPRGKKKAVPLVSIESSLAGQLSPTRYDTARVYYLSETGQSGELLEQLRNRADALLAEA